MREVGGGIGMGNTCKSMADSCQCMTKPLQYCKVIHLQLIKKKKFPSSFTEGVGRMFRDSTYYLLKQPTFAQSLYTEICCITFFA